MRRNRGPATTLEDQMSFLRSFGGSSRPQDPRPATTIAGTPASSRPSRRGGMVDNAIYVNGIRTDNPASLNETFELLRERQGLAWIGLYRPSTEDI